MPQCPREPRNVRRLITGLATAVLLAATASGGQAEPVTLNGITFSDELGGFRIVSGHGTGSLDDPFVIVEEITSVDPVVLVIRGLDLEFGNPARSNHLAGFAMTKLAINATPQPWHEFAMELQADRGQDSDYYDGLSFGQDDNAPLRLGSDLYGSASRTDEPFDGVVFGGAIVAPGQQVSLGFIVTDNSPRNEFYLVQRRRVTVAEAP